MSGTNTTGMVVRTSAGDLPLVSSPELLGTRIAGKTGRAVRDDCESGAIETLPRSGGGGAHWRIPTVKYLDSVGVPYEIVPATT